MLKEHFKFWARPVGSYLLRLFALLGFLGAGTRIVSAQSPFPPIADNEFSTFIGYLTQWAPLQYFLIATVSIAVVGLLVGIFFKTLSK